MLRLARKITGRRLIMQRRLFSTSAAGERTALQKVMSIPSAYPMTFGCFFTSAKTSFADWFTQRFIEKRHDIDWRRNSVFVTFGFIYMGGFQYLLYVKLMAEKLFPNAGVYAAKSLRDKLKDRKGTFDLFKQVALDQIIHVPFIFYPTYYVMKEGILNSGDPDGSDESFVTRALKKYRGNFVEDVKASWVIWWPCNIINFGFMPNWARIPFMACCSMGFCVVLSMLRGGSKPTEEAVKIFEALPQLDDCELVNFFKQTAGGKVSASKGVIPQEDFMRLFEAMGADRDTAANMFRLADADNNRRLTRQELSTMLFSMCSKTADPARRLDNVFRSLDVDGNGYIQEGELKETLLAMLLMRHHFVRDTTDEDAMGFVAGGAIQPKEATPADRLRALRRSNKSWAELTTLKEIYCAQATDLAHQVLAESDTNDDKRICRKEFSAWLRKDTKAARHLLDVFTWFN